MAKPPLLLDPYLSDSLTQKYTATDKPHVCMTARVVAPERLDFIDLVTSSHNHTFISSVALLVSRFTSYINAPECLS